MYFDRIVKVETGQENQEWRKERNHLTVVTYMPGIMNMGIWHCSRWIVYGRGTQCMEGSWIKLVLIDIDTFTMLIASLKWKIIDILSSFMGNYVYIREDFCKLWKYILIPWWNELFDGYLPSQMCYV